MPANRLTVLEHLTLLQLSPPQFIEVAAAAGFDAVGLRVAPATPGELPWPMTTGSPMFEETVRRLSGCGVRVLTVEALRLDARGQGSTSSEAVFEAAARLGARYLNVISDDLDLDRLTDRFAGLVQAARPYGIRPLIEFMAYKPVHSLAQAVRVAAPSAGGGILLDALHVQRCRVGVAELAALDPTLLSYVQLCDGPLIPPVDLPVPSRMPRGQAFEGGTLALEGRAARLLPGEGQFPLTALLQVLPPDLAAAVEAPNLYREPDWTPQETAQQAYRTLAAVLVAAGTAPLTAAGRAALQKGGPG